MSRLPRLVLFNGAILTLLLFVWTSTHQPMTEARQPDSSSYRRILTVIDFGAVGDGKADDTAAIQRAVNSGIGDVRFPRGAYRITKSIKVALDETGPTSIVANGTARIINAGPGAAIVFVGTHQGTASPHTVTGNVWERQRTPMIDGIEIVGAHPQASGIEATGTMQAIFTRVTVRNALHGIHLTTRNRNVIISECHLYDNHGIGIFLDHLNLHQVNITNCHISYNDMGGIVARDSEIRNLHIGSCDIEGNMSDQTAPTANILLDTRNGTVREGAIVGCTIQHSHNAPNSANVRFIGKSRQEPQKVGHFTIGDNALSDVAVNVELINARGVTIMGNTFWKAFQQNLLVTGSSNIVVGPNLFDRNPDYRPNDSPNGIVFRDCADCTLTGLHINNTLRVPAALIIEECDWFNITACSVLDSDNCGILLRNCEHCRVSDCLVRDSRPQSQQPIAISVTGGVENQIVDNMFVGRRLIEEGTTSSSAGKKVRKAN